MQHDNCSCFNYSQMLCGEWTMWIGTGKLWKMWKTGEMWIMKCDPSCQLWIVFGAGIVVILAVLCGQFVNIKWAQMFATIVAVVCCCCCCSSLRCQTNYQQATHTHNSGFGNLLCKQTARDVDPKHATSTWIMQQIIQLPHPIETRIHREVGGVLGGR